MIDEGFFLNFLFWSGLERQWSDEDIQFKVISPQNCRIILIES